MTNDLIRNVIIIMETIHKNVHTVYVYQQRNIISLEAHVIHEEIKSMEPLKTIILSTSYTVLPITC